MITDWLMVVITTIYVVATIVISWANIKSAKATREQLAESKRQYEDKKRLSIMPYIQIEQTKDDASCELNLVLDSATNLTGNYTLLICMKNIGNGTAKDISYIYEWDNCLKRHDRGAFPVQALSSTESQTIKIDFAYDKEKIEDRNACILFRYRDLLENDYTQQIKINFKSNNNLKLKLDGLSTLSPILIPKEGVYD